MHCRLRGFRFIAIKRSIRFILFTPHHGKRDGCRCLGGWGHHHRRHRRPFSHRHRSSLSHHSVRFLTARTGDMCVDLFSRAFVWPRGGGGHDEFAGIKEGRMKQRLEEINTTIKTQKFHDWLAEQEEHKKKTLSASDSLW
jgi:hypothetical protein